MCMFADIREFENNCNLMKSLSFDYKALSFYNSNLVIEAIILR